MQDHTDTAPLDKIATAKYLGCSVPQIINLVNRGDIPEGQTIGGRKKYWFKVHLDQYIARKLALATESWGPRTPPKAAPTPKKVVKMFRDEVEVQDARRRQQNHIQESCQSEVTSVEANHLRSIIGDLSDLLKSRKSRV